MTRCYGCIFSADGGGIGIIVHAMNKSANESPVSVEHIDKFRSIIEELNRKCHERVRACELFGVNEAELRCLRLFEVQRYLTSTTLAAGLGVAKSRVTRIIDGLRARACCSACPIRRSAGGAAQFDPAGPGQVGHGPGPCRRRQRRHSGQAFTGAARKSLLAMLAMLKAAMEAATDLG